MTPNYERAATEAARILVQYGISAAPVDPFPIIKKLPNVLVISYETMSNEIGIDRKCCVSMLGDRNQDAFTSVTDGKYLVTFNQRLPFFLTQRALARELGHIVLDHDGSRPEKVRTEEAVCFAHHLLAPRALLHAIQATGIPLTTEILGNLTGCYDVCLTCMRKLPPVSVPAELNAKIRDNMMPYIMNFFEFERHASKQDRSATADLGSFMDGYAE